MALKLGCKPFHLFSKMSHSTYDVRSNMVQSITPLFINNNTLDRKYMHCLQSLNCINRETINMCHKTKEIYLVNNFLDISCGKAFIRRKSSFYDTPERGDLPEAPKKPLSPPLVYMNIQKKEDKDAGKTLLTTAQYLEMWTKLNDTEKSKYQRSYQEQLAVYKEKFLEYKNNLTEDEIFKFKKFLLEKKKVQLRKESARLSKTISNSHAKEAESLGKPKYPGSSIFIYWQSLLSDQGEKKLAMPHVIEKWNLLPEDEKMKFKNLFKERFAIYKIDLEKWEQRMNEEGKQHLIRKGSKVEKLDKVKE